MGQFEQDAIDQIVACNCLDVQEVLSLVGHLDRRQFLAHWKSKTGRRWQEPLVAKQRSGNANLW